MSFIKYFFSVVALKTRQYSAGDEITMVLMKRERGSTYTMPKSQWQAREAKPHSVDGKMYTLLKSKKIFFIFKERFLWLFECF